MKAHITQKPAGEPRRKRDRGHRNIFNTGNPFDMAILEFIFGYDARGRTLKELILRTRRANNHEGTFKT